MESRDRELVEERAGEWLARRLGEDWSTADEAALGVWMAESVSHRVAYLRLSSGWERAGRLRAFEACAPVGVVPTVEGMRASPYFFEGERRGAEPGSVVSDTERAARSRRWGEVYRSLVAGLVVAAAFGSVAGYFIYQDRNAYRTELGGIEAVPMVDGSRVTLNTDSRIRVAVTSAERRVELERGEAFFDVASDAARPFVVVVGDERVVAVGTAFSVRRERGGVRVAVTEGTVRIERERVDGNAGVAVPVIEVTAGRVARSDGDGVVIQEKALAEVEQSLSWRTGYLVFRDTPLADAVAEFNRYNAQKMVIEDAYVAGLRIDGNFRSTNVDVFVRLIDEGFPVAVERRGEQIVLRGE